MLDSIRKSKNNLVYTILILATVAVMAFYGATKTGSDREMGGVAAYVNGEAISRREFQQELEFKMAQYQQMLGGQYDERLLTQLQVPQRTLEEQIQYKLLAQQAKKLNIMVPDDELADHIRSLPFYQKDGRFDADAYSKIPNRGMEERRRRERLLIARFQNYIVDRVRLTPEEMKRAFVLRETKVDLDYAKIDFGALAGSHTATAKEIDDLIKSAPETEFQQYYENHKGEYTDKAQVSLRQIRVGIPYHASEGQKADARKKAESIYKELTETNFSDVARKRSDDEFAKKGGNIGWVTRGTLEAPLEAAVEKLEMGKFTAPVESTFGYFILQMVDKKKEVPHPLAEVKKKVAEKLVVEKYKKTFAEKKRQEWDKVLESGRSLEPELKRAKVDIKKTGPFSIGQGYIPNIGQADSMVDTIFTLTKEHPQAKKLFQNQDSYYYLKLRSVESPKDGDFAKNREMLEKSVGTALQTELITQWVNALQKTATIKTELHFSTRGSSAEL